MALSVFSRPDGIDWPLGFVAVANNGTPVNIMHNVDANNTFAPSSTTGERSVACHKVTLVGMHPGANNNGMVYNTGFVYVLRALGPGNNNAGGPGNRSDSGAMVYPLAPGGSVTIPADEWQGPVISPYRYTLDVDVDGEGALVTLLGCSVR